MRLKTAAVTLGAFAILAIAETKRPLRKRVAPRGRRVARNAAMGATSAAVTAVVQWRIGAPPVRGGTGEGAYPPRETTLARRIVNVLLLDYTLWWWHRLNHHVPLLWTFHKAHHEDPDLDVSTGIRFHPGEMALSAFFRVAQIHFLKIDEASLIAWQRMLLVSILFHHSNTRLPERVDRALANVIATPRMHGIHHSNRQEETDSNFASLFSWWDWMHGTMRLDRPQDAITIGAPAAAPLQSDPHPSLR